MGTPYTGSPTATRAPAPQPGPGTVLVITLPVTGDPDDAPTYAQAFESITDAITYISKTLQAGLPSTSSNIPQLRFLDAAGNGRYAIDHNGLPTGGRVSQLREEWAFANSTLSAGVQVGTPWTATLGTASVLSLQPPTASYNGRFLQITPSSTATTGETVLTSWPFIVANTGGMSLVLEFELGLSVAGTTSNVTWYAGLGGSATDPSGDPNLVCLAKKYNNANYSLYTGNGVAVGITATSPATAPTTGAFPTDRIKIEIQGSGSAYGVYQSRFFINDVAVGAPTTMPGATALRLLFGCLNEGGAPSGSPLAYVGPITATWNRFLVGSTL